MLEKISGFLEENERHRGKLKFIIWIKFFAAVEYGHVGKREAALEMTNDLLEWLKATAHCDELEEKKQQIIEMGADFAKLEGNDLAEARKLFLP